MFSSIPLQSKVFHFDWCIKDMKSCWGHWLYSTICGDDYRCSWSF